MSDYISRHTGQEVDDAVDRAQWAVTSISVNDGTPATPDENGNVDIAVTDINISVENSNAADLEFADDNGNVVMRCVDGHVKTANFDSSDGVSSDLYYTKSQADGKFATKSELENSVVNGQVPIKMLVIGNSFSCDSFGLVPFILKNYGINIKIGILYKGGAGINDHVTYYNSANQYWYYSIDTGNGDTAWSKQTNIKLHNIVVLDEWDIVVLQQSSSDSVDDSKFGNVPTLIGKILDDMDKPVLFGWNINHTSYSHDQQQNVLDNCDAAIKANPIDIVFPYGTAVFDGRTNQTLAAIGDGTNLWETNKLHLQEGLPVYLAALTNVQALFKAFYPRFSVMNDTFVPTSAYQFGDIQDHGTIIGVTDANRRLAQKCAIMANKFNFTIKTIQ